MEVQRYLKTGTEFARGREVIHRNTDIVHLCLFVLKLLANEEQFHTILDDMQHYGSGHTESNWNDTIQTEEGLCFTEASLYRTLQSPASATGFEGSSTARAGAVQCSRCNRHAS